MISEIIFKKTNLHTYIKIIQIINNMIMKIIIISKKITFKIFKITEF